MDGRAKYGASWFNADQWDLLNERRIACSSSWFKPILSLVLRWSERLCSSLRGAYCGEARGGAAIVVFPWMGIAWLRSR
jgi:hypothetical protein